MSTQTTNGKAFDWLPRYQDDGTQFAPGAGYGTATADPTSTPSIPMH